MDKITIRGIECFYRPGTTDENCLKEVLEGCYKRKKFNFFVEPGETWLDLGANIGAFSLYANSFGAKTIAFEPDKENFELLKLNNPNGINMNCAFTALEQDKLQFYRGSKETDKYRYTIFKNSKSYLELDNYYAGNFRDQVDAIKMDIEGSEFDLIEKDLLPECQKMVMEYHFLKDRSYENFYRRIKKLKRCFENVYYLPVIDRMAKESETYNFRFDQFIFCWNKI